VIDERAIKIGDLLPVIDAPTIFLGEGSLPTGDD